MSELDVNFLKSRCDSAIERAQNLGLLPIRGGVDNDKEPILALIDVLFERVEQLETALCHPPVPIVAAGYLSEDDLAVLRRSGGVIVSDSRWYPVLDKHSWMGTGDNYEFTIHNGALIYRINNKEIS